MPVDRILIVDDEEAIREIVSSMLTAAHYKCSQAGSGLQALALLESGEEFELMLSDLMMADLDGIGLLERTRSVFRICRSSWSQQYTIYRWRWRRFEMALTTTC